MDTGTTTGHRHKQAGRPATFDPNGQALMMEVNQNTKNLNLLYTVGSKYKRYFLFFFFWTGFVFCSFETFFLFFKFFFSVHSFQCLSDETTLVLFLISFFSVFFHFHFLSQNKKMISIPARSFSLGCPLYFNLLMIMDRECREFRFRFWFWVKRKKNGKLN